MRRFGWSSHVLVLACALAVMSCSQAGDQSDAHSDAKADEGDREAIIRLSQCERVEGVGFDRVTGEVIIYVDDPSRKLGTGAEGVLHRLERPAFDHRALADEAARIVGQSKSLGIRVVTAGPLPDGSGIEVFLFPGQLSKLHPSLPPAIQLRSRYPVDIAGEAEVMPAM